MVRAVCAILLLGACSGARYVPDETDDGPGGDQDRDGYTVADGDCDDGDPAVHPTAEEDFYDGVDADCDGASDDDADGDGFDALARGGDDCDDTDPAVNPDAEEVLGDGVDADCDGESDHDADRDGFDARAAGGDDCDDADPAVNPGATETCATAWDDDCDDDLDDAVDGTPFYLDHDGDGHGDPDVETSACAAPPGYVAGALDCDDDHVLTFPGADDIACDGRDNDCDPETFEFPQVRVDGTPGTDLENAVLLATGGELIELCEGRHVVGNLVVEDGLTIAGPGPDLATVDAEGDALMRVLTTDPVTLRGITFTGGTGFAFDLGTRGGGLLVAEDADVTVEDAVFAANSAGYGAGLYVDARARLSLARVVVRDNLGDADDAVVRTGGGLYLGQDAELDLVQTRILSNESGVGGGMHFESGATLTSDGASLVASNVASLVGGGIDAATSQVIAGLEISDNRASSGGGIHGSNLTVTDVVLDGNQASLAGGGIRSPGQLLLERVTLRDNVSHVDGGAVYTTGLTIRDSVVTGNHASGVLAENSCGVHLAAGTLTSSGTDWSTADGQGQGHFDIWLEQTEIGFHFGAGVDFGCLDVAPYGTCVLSQ